jgi:hypothetical protein
VPVTGNIGDPTFQQRLQVNMQVLKVTASWCASPRRR